MTANTGIAPPVAAGPGRFWQTAEFRQRLVVTVAALLVYRLACHIPMPGVSLKSLPPFGDRGVLGWLMNFGGVGERLSIAALGVWPIYTALLVVEAARLAFSGLRQWERASAANSRRINSLIGAAGVLLAAAQAYGIAAGLEGMPQRSQILALDPGWEFRSGVVVALAGTTALLWWLAGIITRRGLGSGFWLLLLVPVVMGMPQSLAALLELMRQGAIPAAALWYAVLFAGLGTLVLVVLARAGQPSHATGARGRTGIDFAGVWPAILGTWLAPWFGHAALVAGDTVSASSWFATTEAETRFYLLFVPPLVAYLVWLKTRAGAEADGALSIARDGDQLAAAPHAREMKLVWIVAAAHAAICVLGPAISSALHLPFSLSGVWLIILVTVTLRVMEGARGT